MSFMNPSPSVSAAGTAGKRMWHGIYTASVVSTQDPLKQSRVTLKVPQVLGTSTSNWAVPIGYEPVIPVVNQVVWAMFLGGDINHPLYLYASTTNTTTAVPGIPTVSAINGATITDSTVASPTITSPTITDPVISGATLTTTTLTSPTITTPAITGGTSSGATFTTATLTSPAISTPTITGGTSSGATFTTATLTSPAINTPTITGGTISGATITGGSGTLSGNQVLVNGATGAAQVEVNGTGNFSGNVNVADLSASQVLINGASGSAQLEISGTANITGNVDVGGFNGASLPQSTVATVAAASTGTGWTTTEATFLTTYASAINGIIARLQSAGIIS